MARQSWLFRFQNLLVANQRRIAESITLEQGKTIPDAEGDVLRGMLSATDAALGGVVSELKTKGMWPNSVVVYLLPTGYWC